MGVTCKIILKLKISKIAYIHLKIENTGTNWYYFVSNSPNAMKICLENHTDIIRDETKPYVKYKYNGSPLAISVVPLLKILKRINESA